MQILLSAYALADLDGSLKNEVRRKWKMKERKSFSVLIIQYINTNFILRYIIFIHLLFVYFLSVYLARCSGLYNFVCVGLIMHHLSVDSQCIHTFYWHKQVNVESVRIMVLEVGEGLRILQDEESQKQIKQALKPQVCINVCTTETSWYVVNSL